MTIIERCAIILHFQVNEKTKNRMCFLWFAEWTEAQLVVTFGRKKNVARSDHSGSGLTRN